MELKLFSLSDTEHENHLITTIPIPEDVTIQCEFLDGYIRLNPDLNYMGIFVKEIPYRVDRDEYDDIYILNKEFCDEHPNPYSSCTKWKSQTIWTYKEVVNMYAKLEVILYIPDDKYNELKTHGTPEWDIQKNIEKSVTLRKYPGDVANDIVSVSLLDYEGE